MAIKAYLEYLFHFSCEFCGKWFSIGDWNFSEKLTCPHCGLMQVVVFDNDTADKLNNKEDK